MGGGGGGRGPLPRSPGEKWLKNRRCRSQSQQRDRDGSDGRPSSKVKEADKRMLPYSPKNM